jgi:hypothetical protein
MEPSLLREVYPHGRVYSVRPYYDRKSGRASARGRKRLLLSRSCVRIIPVSSSSQRPRSIHSLIHAAQSEGRLCHPQRLPCSPLFSRDAGRLQMVQGHKMTQRRPDLSDVGTHRARNPFHLLARVGCAGEAGPPEVLSRNFVPTAIAHGGLGLVPDAARRQIGSIVQMGLCAFHTPPAVRLRSCSCGEASARWSRGAPPVCPHAGAAVGVPRYAITG